MQVMGEDARVEPYTTVTYMGLLVQGKTDAAGVVVTPVWEVGDAGAELGVVHSTPQCHCRGQGGPTVSASIAGYASGSSSPDSSLKSSHSGIVSAWLCDEYQVSQNLCSHLSVAVSQSSGSGPSLRQCMMFSATIYDYPIPINLLLKKLQQVYYLVQVPLQEDR